MLELVKCTELAELENYRNRWNDLLLNSELQLSSLSADWIISLLKFSLPVDTSWLVLFVLNNEKKLVGVLPLIVYPKKLFRITMLRTPFNYHTRSGDFLLCGNLNNQIEVYNFLISSLDRLFNQNWFLSSQGVNECSPSYKKQTQLSFNYSKWILNEPFAYVLNSKKLDFADYYSNLGRKTRQNLNSFQRKLEQLPDYEIVFKQSSNVTDSDLSRWFDLESKGWKGQAGTAINKDESLHMFYTELAKKSQMFELAYVSSEKKLIAAYFMFRCGNRLVLHKTAYDEDFHKLSPAHVLLINIIKREAELSLSEKIDFVSDAEWVTKWNPNSEKYFSVNIARGLLAQVTFYWPYRIKLFIKKMLKR